MMSTPPTPPDTVTLWHYYEEIAMHFNSLIMQFRLEVIGGAGALGTLASYLIGGKVTDPGQQNWLRALVSSGLWVADRRGSDPRPVLLRPTASRCRERADRL